MCGWSLSIPDRCLNHKAEAMTTRVSVDDDVAAALMEEAERRGIGADGLANDELRAKLCAEQSGVPTP
jgi:hypothetical protein